MTPAPVPLPSFSFPLSFPAFSPSSLHHTSRLPSGLPPTSEECSLPCSLRGCLDTIRLNLFRGHLVSGQREALQYAGFRRVGNWARSSDKNHVEVWRHPAGLTVTFSRRTGISVTITPALLAFGRNDRISDVSHAGLPSLIEWLLYDLLALTTKAEGSRRYPTTGRGSRLVGQWRVTSLHLTAHLWVDDEQEVDSLLRVLAMGRLGTQKATPRIHLRNGNDGRRLVTGLQAGYRETGSRANRMLVAYDKGWEQVKHGIPCGGVLLPVGRVIRFEYQLNTAEAISAHERLFLTTPPVDDNFPCLPFVDPTNQDRTLVVDEQRCHAVLADVISELVASAAPWPRSTVRAGKEWRALRMRAERTLGEWMALEEVPARCEAGVATPLAMRLGLRRRPHGIITSMYGNDLPHLGSLKPRQVSLAHQMAINKAKSVA